MLKVCCWLWFLVGCFVGVQFFYWFGMTVAHAFGWAAAPNISTFWTAMALAGAGMFSARASIDELRGLLCS